MNSGDDEKELETKKTEAAQKRKLAGQALADLREKNSENISSFRQAMTQLKQEKAGRDKENKAVAEFKERRDSLHKKAGELREQARQLQAKFKETGGLRTGPLRHRLAQLEYALHVEGSSPRREKEISAEMTALGRQLKASEANDLVSRDLSGVRAQLRQAESDAEAAHLQMVEHANKSDEHHARIGELSKKADFLRQEISKAMELLGEKEDAFQEATSDYRQAIGEARVAEEAEREKAAAEKKAEEQTKAMTAKERAAKALEDLKKGKKISLLDIQALNA
ncbi:MAG: hypothetical protein AB1626_00195 [Candidatus Micrarchaeota archaeon]